MSKLKTFTKKLQEITEGWTNYILYKLGLETLRVSRIAKKRSSICHTCDFNVNGVCSTKKSTIVDGVEIWGCGCPLEKKVRSMKSNCPLNKWQHDKIQEPPIP